MFFTRSVANATAFITLLDYLYSRRHDGADTLGQEGIVGAAEKKTRRGLGPGKERVEIPVEKVLRARPAVSPASARGTQRGQACAMRVSPGR